MRLHVQFKKGKTSPYLISRKKDHPDLYHIYPEAKVGVIDFCTNNLEDLKIEKVHSYIFCDFLKQFDSGDTRLGSDDTSEGQVMMHNLKSKPPGIETTWRWMKKMGRRYNNCCRRGSGVPWEYSTELEANMAPYGHYWDYGQMENVIWASHRLEQNISCSK